VAHIVEDNVRETATTTGTGSFSLGGAAITGRTFSSVMADGDTCHYAIHHATLNEWEIGFGTYETTGNLLLRTTPAESSNGGAAVNFSAGNKTVEMVLPGSQALFLRQMTQLTGVVRVDAGVPTADTDVTDIVAAASTSAAGKVELADNAETLAGTDAARVVTPDGLAAYWEKGTDNTGGATITLGDGGMFDLITSTTAITAFAFTTDKAGRSARIRFLTARVLTHNATTLLLPFGGANITTEVGDRCTLVSLGSGNFYITDYVRSDGRTVLGPTDPNVFDFADDFYGNVVASPVYPWTETTSAAGTNNRQVVADHPGVLRLVTGAVSGNNKRIHLGVGETDGILLPVSVQRFSWIVRIPTITTIVIRLGLLQQPSAANGGTAGAFFEFDPTQSANWRYVTRQASTSTANNALTVTANNWYVLEARRLGSGNWEFYVNGVLRATNSANLPTTACNFGALCQTATAAARNLDLDFGAIRSLAQRFT
jgi:hypothetical protein